MHVISSEARNLRMLFLNPKTYWFSFFELFFHGVFCLQFRKGLVYQFQLCGGVVVYVVLGLQYVLYVIVKFVNSEREIFYFKIFGSFFYNIMF